MKIQGQLQLYWEFQTRYMSPLLEVASGLQGGCLLTWGFPTLVLTVFGAGHGHNSDKRLATHSSGPSAHRWYRWHCHGSQGWASRLRKERLRG